MLAKQKSEQNQDQLNLSVQEGAQEMKAWEHIKELNESRIIDLEKQLQVVQIEISRVKAMHERLSDQLKGNLYKAANEQVMQHLRFIETAK